MKPKIALFVHQPECSVQCVNGMMRALEGYYDFRLFSKNQMEDGFFDAVDMVAFPGGIGDSDRYDRLATKNQDAVRNYVAGGGRYLGICMGAYWASKEYFNILKDVEAVQYMTRPATDTKRPHAKNLNVTWNGQPEKMFWYDGCALVGDETKFQTIGRYANGDPMAIIQDRIGLIGCHPEAEEFWYDMYSWMKGRYHNGRHHQLLLEFVDQLFVTK